MHIEIQNCFSFWGTSSPDPHRGFAPGPHRGTSVTQTPAQDVPTHFVPGLCPCQTNGTDGSWDSDDVQFPSLECLWPADIGPWMVSKSGHVTITKIENLHIDTRRKIHWFQKC